jgi:valyl-tRNA synthetase
MDKVYKHQEVEEKWYKFWENSGYFTPRIPSGQAPKKQPFCIILPPPNANANLHLGHAMYVVEDILIRYHRMKGDATLWLPGADHAGFETQYVFEKELAKEGKSRFDFSREELYEAIWNFVQKNRGNMENQLRRLGFSLDWTRQVFTLDPKIVSIVYKTFKKLSDDGLVYRGERLVNYCTRCGTGFSDLEIKYIEQNDPLYFLKYGPFILATVRPETKFGDTAVAVHSHDKRYQKWIGKEIEAEGLLGEFKLKVIADDTVDPKFGTGVVKITPAHDFGDFETGKRHHLPIKQVIGFDGRLTAITGPYAGMKVKAARTKIVEDLMKKGLIDHVDEKYSHSVATCYKCGSTIEPLPLPQWYIKIEPLAKIASLAIKNKEIVFAPKRFEKIANEWLKGFHDWNVSRQIVWGIRIPAWQCIQCKEWTVTEGKKPEKCSKCGNSNLTQDPDVFDTWFSSGQWPFATLMVHPEGSPRGVNRPGDYDYFYPTSVMETGYDILPWWVCRMIMLGIYVTGTVPFKTVCLHGMVRDVKGQKMSKSKGNVINPITMTDLYGADALRMALVFGTAFGNDVPMSEDKIRGMRNFSNKLWNIGRFIKMNIDGFRQNKLPIPKEEAKPDLDKLQPKDKRILSQLGMLERRITRSLEDYHFDKAANALYKFIWHAFADKYIEAVKERLRNNNQEALHTLLYVYITSLKLLHPFMPFITEELHRQLLGEKMEPLIISPWPKV